jgi:hypothetical protein
LLVACDSVEQFETTTVGPYTLQLSHSPLKVGYEADLRLLLLGDAGQAVSGCDVVMRQYMLGMEMGNDQQWLVMSMGSDGEYTAHSHEFTMGGEWSLELKLDCANKIYAHIYNFSLEWPE